MKGIYSLLIRLNNDKNIRIGSLGSKFFKKGYYVYVGSALNNLEKRILRHKSKEKKIRWHIDHFLNYGKIVKVSSVKTNKKIECKLSDKINKISLDNIEGFGCSDCRCKSHLYYFNKKPKCNLK